MIASRVCPSATPGASKRPSPVGPAVPQLGEHRANRVGFGRAIERDDAADPAHQSPQAWRSAGSCASALNDLSARALAFRRISSTRVRSAASDAAASAMPPRP